MDDIPILDNHIHLKEQGSGLEGAKEFEKAGGTHMVLVNLPSWSYGISLTEPDDYRKAFQKTVSLAKKIEKNLDLDVYPVVGVHPAELTKWMEAGRSLSKTIKLMKEGLRIARKFVEENKAVAIGEIGRPHYSVDPKIMNRSMQIFKFALEQAKIAGCPVQVHMDKLNSENIKDLKDLVEEVGIEEKKVIKHFAEPAEMDLKEFNYTASVTARKQNINKLDLCSKKPFMFETDYLDDPNRPGAVLGPKTVPRRFKWLLNQDKIDKSKIIEINKKLPEKIYNISIEL
ncbi:MAG: putative metal-dependent hydrolase urease superfamily [Candidatus Methanohalarchaeum thermophilum]|uniref:Metal-dependent hydrolase urease superfamily n=1 Tax=Methanohalarchaeum thermophilum TaxID=1903181 RepID=A0A1Q6DW56_METT1|nr:MAG: putative metal-dependent hydrolase urease superfamily [Candidatus Methanohalarchaeum thermophilum]